MIDLLLGLGVTQETIDRMHRIEQSLVEPTEEQVAEVVWAIDLDICDDRMIPACWETMNGVVVPRWTTKLNDGAYLLQPSRVLHGTAELVLRAEEAPIARARYLLWHSYYIRAYANGKLSYIQKDAARRLYWHGDVPPHDPERMMVNFEIGRAVKEIVRS